MKPYAAIDQTTVVSFSAKTWPQEELATKPPMKVASSVSSPPTIEASTTFPGRILYIHKPTSSAMGIVQAMVKVPQDEPGTRRTAPTGTTPSIGQVALIPKAGLVTRRVNPSLITMDDLP